MDFRTKIILIIASNIFFVSYNNYAQVDTLWTRTYGTNVFEGVREVRQTSDGGFIMVGEQIWFDNDPSRIFVVKTDSVGNYEWLKAFGGYSYDVPYTITTTKDGGYLIGGESTSFDKNGIFILRLDNNGDSLWMKIFGNDTFDHLTSKSAIVETEEGEILITGWGWRSPRANQIILFKLDAIGNLIWEKDFGGSNDEFSNTIQICSSGGYLIAGLTYSFGEGLCDGYLVRIDDQGNIIWTETYGGHSYDSFYSAKETLDGGFIAVGSTQSFGNREQGYIVKTNTLGKIVWFNVIGDSANENLIDVCPVSGDHYLVCGYTNSTILKQEDGLLVLLNKNGEVIEQKLLGGTAEDFMSSVIKRYYNNYIVGGRTRSWGYGDMDFWLLSLKIDTLNSNIIFPENYVLFQNFPNPFNPSTTIKYDLPKSSVIKLSVYNLLGEEIELLDEGYRYAGSYETVFDASHLSSGVYIYRLVTENYSSSKKMILIK